MAEPTPGVYERRLLRSAAETDTSSTAIWLQGASLFCDIRFTATNGSFDRGVAGRLEHNTASDLWQRHHAIAAGGASGTDIGMLTDIDGWGLLETGADAEYAELWQHTPATGPIREFHGRDDAGHEVIALAVGDRFGLAASPGTFELRDASVHLGARDGATWRTEHSSTPTTRPPRFALRRESPDRLAIARLDHSGSSGWSTFTSESARTAQ